MAKRKVHRSMGPLKVLLRNGLENTKLSVMLLLSVLAIKGL